MENKPRLNEDFLKYIDYDTCDWDGIRALTTITIQFRNLRPDQSHSNVFDNISRLYM